MSNFTEAMQTNPPRLAVLFQRADDGSERFQWGVVGAIPILTLIGYVARVQAELVAGTWIQDCDNEVPALVITWDAADGSLTHFVHPDIPADSLVGMLETIKAALVGSRMGQHTAAQKMQILGPDGRPMGM